MRSITLLALATLFACSNGSDATKDDTDAANDTDGGGTADDTDVASEDTDSDTDGGGGAWGAAAVGTWTPTAQQAGCGVSFALGLVGAAVVDQPNAFTLTMTESVGLQQMAFSCTFSDATTYACESEVVSSGDVTACLYQTALTGIGGTVVGAVGTVSVSAGQSAVGQYCPPISPCAGTATATATIAE